MAEEKDMNLEQRDLLRKLKAIGADLWGGEADAPDVTDTAGKKAPAPAPAPAKKSDGLESLWKTADETIDWTDALAHSTPTDGLTGVKIWRFFHEKAEKVLAGDTDAYTEVLRRANPLGELTDYAGRITMRAPSSDRLESTFICKQELLEKKGEKYLAAMGLRIARDLLACLPVTDVAVTGETEDGRTVFKAVYPRTLLHHRNFVFLDPVELAREAGAEFSVK